MKVFLLLLIFSCWPFLLRAAQEEKLVKITPHRMLMGARLQELCIPLGAVVGPHSSAEVDIYVNDLVLAYRRKQGLAFDYPVGSIFVKKKYPSSGAASPDIATVMRKVTSDGTVYDWEFSMVSLPDGKKIPHKGRVSCVSCHEDYQKRGYISRESEQALQDFLQGELRGKAGVDGSALAEVPSNEIAQ